MERPFVPGQRLRDIGTDVETQRVAIGSRELDAAHVGDHYEGDMRAVFDA